MPPMLRAPLRVSCIRNPLPLGASSSSSTNALTSCTSAGSLTQQQHHGHQRQGQLQRSQRARGFSSTAVARSSDEPHYDAPSGWLWGVPPGTKPPREGWEGVWMYGFYGSFVVAAIAYAFKPDTSIQTWALEEARRRLEKEGILTDE